MSQDDINQAENYVGSQEGAERTAIAGLGPNPYFAAASQISPSSYALNPQNTNAFSSSGPGTTVGSTSVTPSAAATSSTGGSTGGTTRGTGQGGAPGPIPYTPAWSVPNTPATTAPAASPVTAAPAPANAFASVPTVTTPYGQVVAAGGNPNAFAPGGQQRVTL